jgi:hypothetical protein
MGESFVQRYFPLPIIEMFGGLETMSQFPILEWNPEWNDLRYVDEFFCPTEPRWIAKDKIIAPFMMGVAMDHDKEERPFVLVRTTATLPVDDEEQIQIFMLYRYLWKWIQTCWTSDRSRWSSIQFDWGDHEFNEFDPRYDDATAIFNDETILWNKQHDELKVITTNEYHQYDPRKHGAVVEYDSDTLDDHSWNSGCDCFLFDESDNKIEDEKLADRIKTLVTTKSIMANYYDDDDEEEELIEYKIY